MYLHRHCACMETVGECFFHTATLLHDTLESSRPQLYWEMMLYQGTCIYMSCTVYIEVLMYMYVHACVYMGVMMCVQ